MTSLKKVLNHAGFIEQQNSHWKKKINEDKVQEILQKFSIEGSKDDINDLINEVHIIINLDKKLVSLSYISSNGDNKQYIDIQEKNFKNFIEWIKISYSRIEIQEEEAPEAIVENIEHLRKYGWKAYGFKNNYSTEKEFYNMLNEQVKLIKEGNPPVLVDGENYRFFRIYNHYDIVGDITLVEQSSNVCELDITIFDRYSGNNFGKIAIEKLLEKVYPTDYNYVEALIRLENAFKNKIRKILSSLDFEKCTNRNTEIIEYWVYPNCK